MADATAALGVYQPRRPPAWPLFRLVQDHLLRLQTVYDERFAREYGPWRPVVAEVAEKFLACGVLEHGFARIRCDACAHEYLLAFSCKGRYCCPSCHAKRLAIWAQWLDTRRLAPVPHRQVVLTIPKRLRAYGRYRRRLLGEIARVAARTLTAAIRTLTGQRDLAVGIVACLQTHGSRANWHPHLHLLVTDGGFRPDGTCVSWPVHDTARATEAFRRAVLRRSCGWRSSTRTRPRRCSRGPIRAFPCRRPSGSPRTIARLRRGSHGPVPGPVPGIPWRWSG